MAHRRSLLALIQGATPLLHQAFESIRSRMGTPWEEESARRVYARLPPRDFSGRVLVPGMLLAVLSLSAGCASSASSEWVKAGVTDERRERDKNECLFDSVETLPSAQGPQRRLNQDRYRRCLEARGYELKSIPRAQ